MILIFRLFWFVTLPVEEVNVNQMDGCDQKVVDDSNARHGHQIRDLNELIVEYPNHTHTNQSISIVFSNSISSIHFALRVEMEEERVCADASSGGFTLKVKIVDEKEFGP